MKSLIAGVIVSLFTVASARADVLVSENQKTVKVNCAKTPDVSVLGNQNTITTSGTCNRISVSGNQNSVNGTATTVSITGNDNTVKVTADEVSVTGNDNTVSVPRALKLKKPKVSNLGNDNTVN